MGLWLKSCPKCKGDLYSDRDIMGYYRQCLQCGYTFYEQRRREARTPVRALATSHVPPEDEGEESGGSKPALSEAA
jgi:DNA-directed RNA polymerase subunit M/transcription elongation factor TFIIS